MPLMTLGKTIFVDFDRTNFWPPNPKCPLFFSIRSNCCTRDFLAGISASQRNVDSAIESKVGSSGSETYRDYLVNPSWVEDLELGEGPVEQLDPKENTFFQVNDYSLCKCRRFAYRDPI